LRNEASDGVEDVHLHPAAAAFRAVGIHIFF
jgi:hypothetical protein